MNSPPRLVIFDCDGVLVDTEGPGNEIIARNLSRRGMALTAQDCRRLFIGGTMADVAVKVRAMGADIPEDWVDQIYAEMYARLRQGIDAIPGIHDVLDRLDAAGIAYCVASNGAPEKMDITLGQTGLLSRFGTAMFSPHVIGMNKAKPDPGLFRHALAEMGATAARAVVVEDSVNGARGAFNAGIRCFGFAAETNPEELRAVGAVPFHSMAELPGLLGLG